MSLSGPVIISLISKGIGLIESGVEIVGKLLDVAPPDIGPELRQRLSRAHISLSSLVSIHASQQAEVAVAAAAAADGKTDD